MADTRLTSAGMILGPDPADIKISFGKSPSGAQYAALQLVPVISIHVGDSSPEALDALAEAATWLADWKRRQQAHGTDNRAAVTATDGPLVRDPDAWKTLGAALRNARETRGWSRRQLADKAGISEKAIQVAEEGRVPKGRWPQSLQRITAAFDWKPGAAQHLLNSKEAA